MNRSNDRNSKSRSQAGPESDPLNQAGHKPGSVNQPENSSAGHDLKRFRDDKQWAAAATLMTLSVALRCAKDFHYYKSIETGNHTVWSLILLCRRLCRNGYTLFHHLPEQLDPDHSPFGTALNREAVSVQPFYFLLGRLVSDDLESLHRELLFFDPDQIVDIIPVIDGERKFWKDYNQAEFYSHNLNDRLNEESLAAFREIEIFLHSLRKRENC